MKKTMIAVLLVLFLNSCTWRLAPEEYVILIEGDQGKDLSGKVPVKVYNDSTEESHSSCGQFIIPPAPQRPAIPVFASPEKTTNKMVVEALMSHIERLQTYITERNLEVRDAYLNYTHTCDK
jgi:hypothetical protein